MHLLAGTIATVRALLSACRGALSSLDVPSTLDIPSAVKFFGHLSPRSNRLNCCSSLMFAAAIAHLLHGRGRQIRSPVQPEHFCPPQSAAVEPEWAPFRARLPRIYAIRYLPSPRPAGPRLGAHRDRDEGAFTPNLYHVVAQLNDCESFRTRTRKPFAEFDDEVKTGDT
jgi:hypothetical protein